MTHTYQIKGMTCSKCVEKVQSALLEIADIQKANVQLNAPQATLTMRQHVSLQELQKTIYQTGNYTIHPAEAVMHETPASSHRNNTPQSGLQIYRPLLLLIGYISVGSLLLTFSSNAPDIPTFLRFFMAGFFLCFSFFKFLDINGFASSYAGYDLLAQKWYPYGYIYPFIELGLGMAYLSKVYPSIILIITLIVMGFSSIGVIRSVSKKRKIRCACLGTVFNLPMSTVTIVEDLAMVAMAGIMLVI